LELEGGALHRATALHRLRHVHGYGLVPALAQSAGGVRGGGREYDVAAVADRVQAGPAQGADVRVGDRDPASAHAATPGRCPSSERLVVAIADAGFATGIPDAFIRVQKA
jgi:hypothetical protein